MSIKSLVKKVTKQTAVYWAPIQLDNDGHMAFDEPIEIACRWVDTNKLFITAKGEESVSSSMIIVRNQPVKVDGVLWLGKLEDLEDQDEPEKNPGYAIIKSVSNVPDIKAKTIVHTAIC